MSGDQNLVRLVVPNHVGNLGESVLAHLLPAHVKPSMYLSPLYVLIGHLLRLKVHNPIRDVDPIRASEGHHQLLVDFIVRNKSEGVKLIILHFHQILL